MNEFFLLQVIGSGLGFLLATLLVRATKEGIQKYNEAQEQRRVAAQAPIKLLEEAQDWIEANRATPCKGCKAPDCLWCKIETLVHPPKPQTNSEVVIR